MRQVVGGGPVTAPELTGAEQVALSDAIGRELYESLMEATADQWRQWRFLTEHAKSVYMAEGSRIVAEGLSPAVSRILADRTAALEAERDDLRRLLERCAERVRHDHAYPMEFGPHHCDGCDLKADLRQALAAVREREGT